MAGIEIENELPMLFEPQVPEDRRWGLVVGCVNLLRNVPDNLRPGLLEKAQMVEVIFLYNELGMNTHQVGDRVGVCQKTVVNWFKEWGVSLRKRGERVDKRPYLLSYGDLETEMAEFFATDFVSGFWDDEKPEQGELLADFFKVLLESPNEFRPDLVEDINNQEIAHAYLHENRSLAQIAKRLGVDDEYVLRRLRKLGVSRRSRGGNNYSLKKRRLFGGEQTEAERLGLIFPEAGVPDYEALEGYGLTPDMFEVDPDERGGWTEDMRWKKRSRVRMGYGPPYNEVDWNGQHGEHADRE